jgi:hypothetical protein
MQGRLIPKFAVASENMDHHGLSGLNYCLGHLRVHSDLSLLDSQDINLILRSIFKYHTPTSIRIRVHISASGNRIQKATKV